jgi:hypothetical protein
MIRKGGHRFSEKIMLKQGMEHDPEKWAPVFPKRSCSNKEWSMIRKSGHRFSEKIMLKQGDEIIIRCIGS